MAVDIPSEEDVEARRTVDGIPGSPGTGHMGTGCMGVSPGTDPRSDHMFVSGFVGEDHNSRIVNYGEGVIFTGRKKYN